MIDKRVESLERAVAGISDGSVVLTGGFGQAGNPTDLIHALIDQGSKDLTVVNNNAGNAHIGLAALLETGRVRKMICTYPRSTDSEVITELYREGRIELEIVAAGNAFRAPARCRRRHRRVLHADHNWHAAGRRQRSSDDRRQGLCTRIRACGRRRAC